jgi:hypothetical protein
MVIDGGDGMTLLSPSGKKTLITKDFTTVSGESGLYSLTDSNGMCHAIGFKK